MTDPRAIILSLQLLPEWSPAILRVDYSLALYSQEFWYARSTDVKIKYANLISIVIYARMHKTCLSIEFCQCHTQTSSNSRFSHSWYSIVCVCVT